MFGGIGNYTVAVGAFNLDENEARPGSNPSILRAENSGAYNLRVASLTQFGGGTGVAVQTVVPEPSTGALLAFGLLGMGLARRRKQST